MKFSDKSTLDLLKKAWFTTPKKDESDPQERWERRQQLLKEGKL